MRTNKTRDRKFKRGDKVTVAAIPKITFAPGVRDEIGTKKLFRSMLGKVYTVRGFDDYRNIELHPDRSNWIWIEPEFLKLRARKPQRKNVCLAP